MTMEDLQLPETPPRQPFTVLTETPTPTSMRGTYRPAVKVQQFSLRSRWAHPYPHDRQPKKPPNTCLRTTERLTAELPCKFVELCKCSWAGPLKPGQKRLCKHETDEHHEYMLFKNMCLQFAVECAREDEDAKEIARLATEHAVFRQSQVFFIVLPLEEIVIGYVAFRGADAVPDAAAPRGRDDSALLSDGLNTTAEGVNDPLALDLSGSGSDDFHIPSDELNCPAEGVNSRLALDVSLSGGPDDFHIHSDDPDTPASGTNSPLQVDVSTLCQIYLSKEYRGQGFATAALKTLLARRTSIVVENTTNIVARRLSALDFTYSNDYLDTQGVRRTEYTRGFGDENDRR